MLLLIVAYKLIKRGGLVNLNTSNVTVNLIFMQDHEIIVMNLNTSNVTVNPHMLFIGNTPVSFKYI